MIQRGEQLTALEVKSGVVATASPGWWHSGAAHGRARKLLVGGDGTALDDFLADDRLASAPSELAKRRPDGL